MNEGSIEIAPACRADRGQARNDANLKIAGQARNDVLSLGGGGIERLRRSIPPPKYIKCRHCGPDPQSNPIT